MYNDRRIVAIIPARGGSKGLPGKNILPLNGKPLIGWTIDAARKSRYLDKVIVTTDCPKIAGVAERFHAEVPFLRPEHLATDDAKGTDVIRHAVEWLEQHNTAFELALTLQPTSPLRTTQDIDQAIELFFNKNAKAIVSVCECDHHPWWSNTLPEDNSLKGFIRPEVKKSNRQELPNFYRLNGAIYLTNVENIKHDHNLYDEGCFAYVMPQKRSIDIDSSFDLKFAELILTKD